MNIQEDQSNPHKHIDLRMRTLRTLWLALFFSVGFYYVLTLFIRRNENAVPNNTLSITLVMVALSATLISFLVKNKLLARAVEQQQVQMVQQAYVVAWAINDVAALLGDRKSTRLNSSHLVTSYAVFCLKKKIHTRNTITLAHHT